MNLAGLLDWAGPLMLTAAMIGIALLGVKFGGVRERERAAYDATKARLKAQQIDDDIRRADPDELRDELLRDARKGR